METERKVIVAPEPSLDFKFRKISLAWILTLGESIQIMLEQGGPELASAGVYRTAEVWAGKLGKHIVTWRIHDPASVVMNTSGDDFTAVIESFYSPFFIDAHQTAVAFNIGA